MSREQAIFNILITVTGFTRFEWLETAEDLQIVRYAMAELKAAGGDLERAGWRRWEDVREELG